MRTAEPPEAATWPVEPSMRSASPCRPTPHAAPFGAEPVLVTVPSLPPPDTSGTRTSEVLPSIRQWPTGGVPRPTAKWYCLRNSTAPTFPARSMLCTYRSCGPASGGVSRTEALPPGRSAFAKAGGALSRRYMKRVTSGTPFADRVKAAVRPAAPPMSSSG